MLGTYSIPVLRGKVNEWAIGLSLGYLLILLIALRSYLLWQSVNMILGSIAIPMVALFQRNQKGSVRYAFVAFLFAMASIWLPVNTLLYFTVVFAIFFVAETFLGKMNMLPLLVCILMSPVFQFMANVFSFPVRLQLTSWAGNILNLAGIPATVHGNLVECNHHQFTVDPACIGLNMIVTSLLLQIIMIAVYRKKYGRRAPWWIVLLLLGMISGLNIFSNLCRIVMLVWFNIPPETSMHELTGIACLLLYVILPAVFITGRWIKWKGKQSAAVVPSAAVTWHRALHLALLGITAYASTAVVQHNQEKNIAGTAPSVKGYTVQTVGADVLKLQNERSLMYIKPIPAFYSAEHNPMICWRGSGYELKQIAEEKIGQLPVYVALLQKGKDRLYTAWWYDNGSLRTIDQMTWRWAALKGGKNFSLVNVTAESREILDKEIEDIVYGNRLQKLLN